MLKYFYYKFRITFQFFTIPRPFSIIPMTVTSLLYKESTFWAKMFVTKKLFYENKTFSVKLPKENFSSPCILKVHIMFNLYFKLI